MTTGPSIERPYGWVVVIASLLLMTVGAGGYFIVIVGLTLVAEDFGGLRWIPSLAYSLALLGMGFGGIFIGRWSERVGVGKPALIGAVMIALGSWSNSVASSHWALLASHAIFIGLIGNAALFSPLIANVAHWFDRRRGIAVSIVASAQGLAGIIWPTAFRYLIETTSWRESYRLYAGFAVVTMVPLSLLLWPRAPAPIVHSETREVDADDRVLGFTPGAALVSLCVAIVGCCVAMAMPIVHVVAYVTDLGYPLARGAEVLAILLGFGFLSRIAWGALGDRWGGLRVLLVGSMAQAAVLSAYLVVDSLIGIYIVSAFFGLAFGGIIPSYTLVVSRYFSRGSLGWRIATVYFFGAIGMATGGWLGGFLYDTTGSYRNAFAVGLVFNLLNLIIVATLLKREERPLEVALA